MRAYYSKSLAILLVVGLALALLPSVQAQEGPKPEAVGLRPDAPPYALHGPYWVGTLELAADSDLHRTRVALWYPALNPEGREEAIDYPFPYGPGQHTIAGHALQDAPPDTAHGPYPLVIYAHGWTGGPHASVYLCEHLASQGFVVMAIEYADNYGTANSMSFESTWYARPQDVIWQIDEAAALTAEGQPLAAMIDLERVAVTGWSLGGYTALASAGAPLDLRGIHDLCANYPAYDWMCKYLDLSSVALKAGLGIIPPEGMWPSWGDPRVDAVVALAPWVLAQSAESMGQIRVPALVLVGSLDQSVMPEFEFYKSLAYDSLGSAQKSWVVFDYADHFLMHNPCRDWPWRLAQVPAYECYQSVWDMDRAHDLINHFTTAFLLAELKGDKDAAAALAPDAVSFPGITYEAQGF